MAIIPSDLDGVAVTNEFPLFNVRACYLDANYLRHFVQTPAFLADLERVSQGASGQNRVSQQAFLSLTIPLPPLDEQRRIASILDRATGLLIKRTRVQNELDELVQSIFQSMFGDHTADQKLASGCTRITDGTHQSPQWTDSGVPFLFISNIVRGEIDFDTEKFISVDSWRTLTQHSPIDVGDVLYSSVVASYGAPAVVRVDRQFAFQRHIAHLKPKPDLLHPDFLATMLASPLVKQQADRAARGAAQPTVNLADIKKFDVIIPPFDEQAIFASRIQAVRSVRTAAGSMAAELDDLFISLRSLGFAGQL